MRAQVRNTKISELQVREDLNFLEREWVIGRLVSKAGVQEALCRPDDPRKFIVEHDVDVLDIGDLLEFLQMCGLQANVTPSPHRLAVGEGTGQAIVQIAKTAGSRV